MNRIKELRTKKGLSLEALANKININHPQATTISKMQLSRYERDESEPPSDVWYRLAGFFDVSVTYLMGFTETKKDFNFGELSELLNDYSKKQNKDVEFSYVMDNFLALIKSIQPVGGIDNNHRVGNVIEILLAITVHITSNNTGFIETDLVGQSDPRLFELMGKLNAQINEYIEGLMDATNVSIFESFQEKKLEQIPIWLFNEYNNNFTIRSSKSLLTHEDIEKTLNQE